MEDGLLSVVIDRVLLIRFPKGEFAVNCQNGLVDSYFKIGNT